ncbi:MAG: hypothetical protein HY680_10565 [Chloroflexi bacterium]|nr:hypothetical protein [Chloroflexota bacterium]
MPDASKDLKQTINALVQSARGAGHGPVDTAPACAFGAVVDQRLKDLEKGLEEVKSRLNSLIYLVAGAVLIEVVMRLMG